MSVTRRRRVGILVATLLFTAGTVGWFAYGPMARVVCATAGWSLDKPSDTKLWACKRSCVKGWAHDCVYYDEMQSGDIREMQRLLNAAAGETSPPMRPAVDRADDAARAQIGCDDGDGAACGALGDAYAGGGAFDPEPDSARSRAAWARGCDLGHAPSCTKLGERDFTSSPTDYARAIPLLRRGCDGADGYGCALLASAYHEGRGVAVDETRSVQLYDSSCALGSARGCGEAMQAHDRAGETQRALELALRGCALDDETSCYRVATWGDRTPLPPAVVAVLERRCAAQPTGSICYGLGLRLIAGAGLDADPTRGRAMFLRACHADASSAQAAAACDAYADLVEGHAGSEFGAGAGAMFEDRIP
jgi:hypothetical protein